ncbi:MAG: asparagine synthase-related protein [Candidatus Sifarchaeia archaeon]
MVKLNLRFSSDKQDDFFKISKGVFSLFRGDTSHDLTGDHFQAFVKFDSRVNDGSITETDDSVFIEIGINYSDSETNEKIESCLEGSEQKLRSTLDGEVCQIHFSKSTKQLTIVTDPYGLLPLYYYKSVDELIISTDLKGVLGIKPALRSKINRQSVAEYLTIHSIMNSRTLFEDVYLISEGIRVQLSTDDLTTWHESEWYSLPKSYEERSLDDWYKLVRHELIKAVKKREHSGIGAFLSGGMDSRLILAAVSPEIRSTMKALTFGVEGSDDLRMAERVAKRFGIQWFPVTIDPNEAWKDGLKHMWLSDGASNHMVSSILRPIELVAVDSLFDGTPGDANLGGGYASNLEELYDGQWPYARSKYILKWLQKKGIARKVVDVSHIMKDTTVEELEEIISTGLEIELQRLPEDMTILSQMENSLYRIRVRRNTMGGQYSIDSISVSLKPYYDVGLHEAFLKIPAQERRNHIFFNRFVQVAFPEVLRDPTDRVLPLSTVNRVKRKIARYIRAILRRIGLRIWEPKPWLNTSKLMGENPEYRKWLASILRDSRTASRGFIDTEAALKLLKDHKPGIEDYSILLVNAIDLELVFRLFADGEGFEEFGSQA